MVLVALGILIFMLALSVPVGAALGVLGVALENMYTPMPLTIAVGEISWGVSSSFILVAVPFFVLLGEIFLRSGIAERMYAAFMHWVGWLPGGIMHSNIAACAMFAATSGSSVATAATIGTVAVNQIEKYKYNEPLFLGSLAAGGTLGILIPPSINFIVYGVLTETSVPQLFLAGIIPGIALAILFMATILVACLFRRSWGGVKLETDWNARIRSLPDLLPPLAIFALVIGSIYAGWATPTESAALAVVAALFIAAVRGKVTLRMLRDVLEGTMKTTAMIMAIVIGAYFLNFVITAIGLTQQVNDLITQLGLSPTETLLVIIAFYVVIGMFMETLSMMVATVPIITPVIVGLGYDPVWFGVLVVLLVETAMITPPVGINLYVVQGVRDRGQLHDVMLGAAPFVLTLGTMIVLIVLFPEIALWLPSLGK